MNYDTPCIEMTAPLPERRDKLASATAPKRPRLDLQTDGGEGRDEQTQWVRTVAFFLPDTLVHDASQPELDARKRKAWRDGELGLPGWQQTSERVRKG